MEAATFTRPHQDALTETFYDMELWLHQIVHEFSARYGGEHIDLMQDASYVFCRVMGADVNVPQGTRWNPELSALTTWLKTKVFDYLMRRVRASKLEARLKRAECDFANTQSEEHILDQISLLLSDDAKTVVDHALSLSVGGCRERAQRALWRQFRDIGWTFKRFEKAFGEVQEVMQ